MRQTSTRDILVKTSADGSLSLTYNIDYIDAGAAPVSSATQPRFFHAEDVKSGTLAKYITENISHDVDVARTDELGGYPSAIGKAGVLCEHKTLKHKDGIYAIGDLQTMETNEKPQVWIVVAGFTAHGTAAAARSRINGHISKYASR